MQEGTRKKATGEFGASFHQNHPLFHFTHKPKANVLSQYSIYCNVFRTEEALPTAPMLDHFDDCASSWTLLWHHWHPWVQGGKMGVGVLISVLFWAQAIGCRIPSCNPDSFEPNTAMVLHQWKWKKLMGDSNGRDGIQNLPSKCQLSARAVGALLKSWNGNILHPRHLACQCLIKECLCVCVVDAVFLGPARVIHL